MMKKSTVLKILRWTILLSILVLVTVMGRLHQRLKLYPSIDAFCPFGTLESLGALIRYQVFLRRIGWSSAILLIVSIVTAIFFKRSFCGNICPLGFLQELFGLGGKSLLKRRFNLPVKLDKILRWIKYPVLLLFIGLAFRTLSLAIRPFDPWIAYHHIGSGELWSEYLIGGIILLTSLVGSIFLDRPFCRYLCPMGAFLAGPSKLSLTRIKRNEESCTNCGECDSACPMAIEVSCLESVNSAECISCGECINACPVEKTLEVTLVGKKKRAFNHGWVLGITLLLFAGTLLVTTLTGNFVWKGETGLPRQTERLLWGPQKINGNTTLAEVSQIFQIHPAYFAQELGLDSEEQFLSSLDEQSIEPKVVQRMVEELYADAGRDPKQLMGGGSCGGH